MAGVDTGADESVADIEACPEGGFHIGAVEGIDIHCVIRTGALGGINQLADHLVVVRAVGILGTDGALMLGALAPVAHAAHVHGDGFADAIGDAGAGTVSHLAGRRR